MLRVNIIGKSNGVGLDRDVKLLTHALRLCDCEVSVTVTGSRQSGWRKSVLGKTLRWIATRLPKPTPRYDLNVMLEHVWTQYLNLARVNVLVANPDFTDRHDVAALSKVDRIWAKTQAAQEIFRNLGCRVTLAGFDSEDRFLDDCLREQTFFHLAGSSVLKGTAHLLDIWARHPQWPMLVVAGRLRQVIPVAANIRVIGGYIEDDQLRKLQNESLVHVCTSETEGWGHYLVEGMSVGATVITLAAPPMNELVSDERGILLSCVPAGLHRLARRYRFDEQALIDAVNRVSSMPQAELEMLGSKARQWFLDNKAGFPVRIHAALQELKL